MRHFLENISQEKYDEMVGKVLDRSVSPYEAVKFLVTLTLPALPVGERGEAK
jgi:hypothetical protein